MRIEVKVPQLPESVAEATLVNWHKKAGDAVKRDENLIDVETDKVVLELPAPGDGVLVEIVKADGSTVTSNDVIAVIDTEAKGAASAPRPMRRRPTCPRPRRQRAPRRTSRRRPAPRRRRRGERHRASGGTQDDGRPGRGSRERRGDRPRRPRHQGRCDRRGRGEGGARSGAASAQGTVGAVGPGARGARARARNSACRCRGCASAWRSGSCSRSPRRRSSPRSTK